MSHWTQNKTLLSNWYQSAHRVAHSAGLLSVAPSRDYNSEEYEGLRSTVQMFMAEVRPLSDFDNPAQAIESFHRWLSPESAEVKPVGPHRVFSATITKNYGDLSVSFGYSAEFDVDKERDTSAAYKFVVRAIHMQFEAYEREGLTKEKPVNVPESQPDTQEHFRVDIIEVENKSDKMYYKCKGGKYTKFGVRVWPEVLQAANIPLNTLQIGDNKLLNPRTATVVSDDGKKGKVIALE